ncbi:hypothetical protein [uncultured Methylobacterium sp.]|jgi:hypothetical protein|uniref:hypothetical protein n=1 Tax=uncultured Methylobacterium sp. TaxID=157278 RepID=UPI002628E89B|nr:hypothetical protein [uncultured Methylobacterium sp.]
MAIKLIGFIRTASAQARRVARAYPVGCRADDLPWSVIRGFDETVRGYVERDPRIEDQRDQVLIAAVNLAEGPGPTDGDAEDDPARARLVKAINDLEWVLLSRGIVNREAAALGYGDAGQRLRDAG